jgi:hypothetical protein
MLCEIMSAQDRLALEHTGQRAQQAVIDLEDLPPHALDSKYASLGCGLTPLARESVEFDAIATAVVNTSIPLRTLGSGLGLCGFVNRTRDGVPEIVDVFVAEREGERERFRTYDGVGNRRLLWHGRNDKRARTQARASAAAHGGRAKRVVAGAKGLLRRVQRAVPRTPTARSALRARRTPLELTPSPLRTPYCPRPHPAPHRALARARRRLPPPQART